METDLTLTVGNQDANREYQQPPLGEAKAIMVDVILSRNEQTKFGVKDLVFFYFELEHLMDDNRPFLVRKKFTWSLNEKSNLFKFLQKWKGGLTPGKPFNVGKLILEGCILEIEPWTSPDGKVLHLVDRARKLDKSKWIEASGEYDPVKTAARIEERRLEAVAETTAVERTEDDDVPF